MTGRCVIVGAGEFDGFVTLPDPDDLVIAADGGYSSLQKYGIVPDVLLGDLDSLAQVPDFPNVIRYPSVKDDTDMAIAVDYAKKKGCREFFLYGGLGGRLDHSIANLQLLTGMAEERLEAYLIGQGMMITALCGESLTFSQNAAGMLSVFCAEKRAEGVLEEGLKYTLTDAVLTGERALGVSNEFTGCESRIAVKKGILWVMWNAGNGFPKKRERI